jgi:arylsulfatase A-like enzyme
MTKFSRRDFLKLMATLPLGYALSKSSPKSFLQRIGRARNDNPNVIILIFDAMSAYDLSLYGYHRKTTPNLERFAKRANVYHAHYSTANFTVPGTASILTGLYPWVHRALHLSGLVARNLIEQNIFSVLGKDYYRFAYSQNIMATNLLHQFEPDIDELLPSSSFSEISLVTSEYFKRDAITAHEVQDNLLFDFTDPPASLIFGVTQRVYFEWLKETGHVPPAIPQPRNHPLVYKLWRIFDGVTKSLDSLQEPYFSYIHLFSPHAPYRARKEFLGMFEDGWQPVRKPEHIFSEGETAETLEQERIKYDQYIANVDSEFGTLLDHLEQTGVLDNSYLIVTSDHGELLERGVKGHLNPLLYEPLMRVPLIISSPGQKEGRDIYSPTTSVDLLPTLLHVTGREIPEWAQGHFLPGLGGEEEPEREIYMLDAKSSSAFAELREATFAMRKGKYKIIMYHGMELIGEDAFELYDLADDPEELNDIFKKEPLLAQELKKQLLFKFEEINKPFSKKDS